ncbi:MAG: hypothetical protein ACFFCD_02845 [Promethearchaeota archaeon]
MSGTIGQLWKNWKAQPKYARIMDATFIILGVLLVIDIVLALALIGISITIDAFVSIWILLYLMVVTLALRLRLIESPEEDQRSILKYWLAAWVFGIILFSLSFIFVL